MIRLAVILALFSIAGCGTLTQDAGRSDYPVPHAWEVFNW